MSAVAVAVPGASAPRVRWTAAGRDVEASKQLLDDFVAFAKLCGVDLMPWQVDVAGDWLAVDAKGNWLHKTCVLIVPRQNGKSSGVMLLLLFKMLVLGERKAIFTSHRGSTTRSFIQDLDELCSTVPAVNELVEMRRRPGEEDLHTVDGRWVKFLSRQKNSGRGITDVGTLVIDEAFVLSAESLESLSFTQTVNRNPQTFMLSSAGDAASTMLESYRRKAFDATAEGRVSKTVCFHEFSASEMDDPSDPEVWAAANPALGITISAERVAAELEGAANLDSFRRERLGIWVGSLAENVIPGEVFASRVVEGAKAPDYGTEHISFGLDVDYDRKGAALACAWLEGGKPRVAVVQFAPAISMVTGRLGEVLRRFELPPVTDVFGVVKPQPRPYRIHLRPSKDVLSLFDELERDRALGLTVGRSEAHALDETLRRLSWGEYTSACQGFLDAVIRDEVSFHPSGSLTAAVGCAGARRDRWEGAWVWERRSADVPVSPLVAASMALLGLRQMVREAQPENVIELRSS